MTQAAAAAKWDRPANAPRKAQQEHRADTLEKRLERRLATARKHRSVIRFFRNHRRLLSSSEQSAVARNSLRRAERGLARTTKEIAALRRALRAREAKRKANAPPKTAICDVFGRYCKQAVAVAWCESRLQTTAQNGQYLGLFQMGSHERRLFGHGSTAYRQAVAAHEYFVRSGRDWSPWSCKPWYAY